jgi:Putative transposase
LAIKLKRAWRDGTTHLMFEPLEFLAKLAALTPRPAINLLIYHGVLAPRGAATLCRLSSKARNLERL